MMKKGRKINKAKKIKSTFFKLKNAKTPGMVEQIFFQANPCSALSPSWYWKAHLQSCLMQRRLERSESCCMRTWTENCSASFNPLHPESLMNAMNECSNKKIVGN
jgi:hypothetical protein